MSTKGLLRGLHFQKNFPQTKLVRVIKGSVFDVAVDLRSGSDTYGKWYGIELTEENKKQFLISGRPVDEVITTLLTEIQDHTELDRNVDKLRR